MFLETIKIRAMNLNVNTVFRKLGTRALVLVSCCVIGVACNKQEELLSLPTDSDHAIESTVLWGPSVTTKGAGELTTATLRSSSFGLFAWWTSVGSYFSGIRDGSLYLDNMEMEYVESVIGGDRWRCSTPTYWPIGCNLTFFAYAPYMDCGGPVLELPNGDDSLLPRGTFTQKTAVREQVDFCLAPPVYDRSSSSGDVPVVLNHALSKVLFYLNIEGTPDEESNFVYRLESMTIDNIVGSNDFVYGNASEGFRWDNLPRTDLSSRTASYTLTRANGELVDDALIHVDNLTDETGFDRYTCVNGLSDGYLYLLPQPMTGSSTVTFIIYGYSVDGGTWTHKTTLAAKVLTLPEETVWGIGNQIAYTATLDITRWDAIINFTATVQPWGSESLSPVIWDNAVYLTRSDLTFSIASVGSEWSCGDLVNNPPLVYVNGTATAVSSWTKVSESSLTAKVATGTFTFTLSAGVPVSVSFVED